MSYDKAMNDFKTKLDTSIVNVSKLSPSQQDKLKQFGLAAEGLINNIEYDTFVNWYKFNLISELTGITGYSEEHNARRIAITHKIAGIEGFADYLQSLIKRKNEVVSLQNKQDPTI